MTGAVPSKTLERQAYVSSICSLSALLCSFDLDVEPKRQLPYVPDNVAVLSNEFRVIVIHALDRTKSGH